MQGVESFGKDLVKGQEGFPVIPGEEIIHQGERIVVVQDIEVPDDILVFDVGSAERHSLVEDREGVAHRSVGLLGDHVEGLVVDLYVFFRGYIPEIQDHVRDRDPVEVVCLAAGQDRRENLVLLCCGENEYGVCRRLLKSLEEGVEGGRREHVHLIDDIDAVLADLRGDLHLVHQVLDVLHTVVGRGV